MYANVPSIMRSHQQAKYGTSTVLPCLPCLVSVQERYQSSIVTSSPFLGRHGEIFRLADGSFWEIQQEYAHLYQYRPQVVICPASEKLLINGESLAVRRLGGFPLGVVGEFLLAPPWGRELMAIINGWEGETIVTN